MPYLTTVHAASGTYHEARPLENPPDTRVRVAGTGR